MARRRPCRPRLPARRGPGPSPPDRGSATLELVIIFPVLLLIIFTVVQASLFFYARSLALAAAQEGVRAARAENAHLPDGVTRARAFLTSTAGDSLLTPTVSSDGSSATQIRIRVTGRSLSVLPGVPGLSVSQEATGPKERFTTAGAP